MSVRPNRPTGAIEWFDLVRFGGPTRSNEYVQDVGITQQEIVDANPDRVLLIIQNYGPEVLRWTTLSKLGATATFTLGVGLMLTFQVQDDGALTGSAINASATTTATGIAVIEVIRDHPA